MKSVTTAFSHLRMVVERPKVVLVRIRQTSLKATGWKVLRTFHGWALESKCCESDILGVWVVLRGAWWRSRGAWSMLLGLRLFRNRNNDSKLRRGPQPKSRWVTTTQDVLPRSWMSPEWSHHATLLVYHGLSWFIVVYQYVHLCLISAP